jgi:FtsZ-interacting cell division protein ZipA
LKFTCDQQPIIEVETQPMEQVIQQPTQVKTIQYEPRYEEVNLDTNQSAYVEQQLDQYQPKVVTEPASVTSIQEREAVTEIINQPIIERHQQPVITEVIIYQF